MSKKIVRGECLCGKVGFELTLPSIWCAHCHCTMCRRAHGAAFVTWVGMRDRHFTLTRGEENLRWHQSSAKGRRGFCSHCGSTFLFQSSRWPGEMHITLANLLDPIDKSPEGNAYQEHRVTWGQG